MSDEKHLKLYVVGEPFSDPGTWGDLSSLALVVAHDANEAMNLSERGGPVAEIDFVEPCVLLHRDVYV